MKIIASLVALAAASLLGGCAVVSTGYDDGYYYRSYSAYPTYRYDYYPSYRYYGYGYGRGTYYPSWRYRDHGQ